MSLNWKEINLILEELYLEGCQIQKASQSAFDLLCLKLYGRDGAKNLLICLSPGACRLHETFRNLPKSDKPLRFAQFLNSRIVDGRIIEACQLGNNRIVRLLIRKGESKLYLYIRLWSNAANVIVSDEEGNILDAMKRQPKKGEISGGRYAPEAGEEAGKEYLIRDFDEVQLPDLPPESSFNRKIDAWYSRQGDNYSLDSLKEEARRNYEGRIGKLKASLDRLREKETDFNTAGKLKEYGDIILANLGSIRYGDEWLETKNFYAPEEAIIRIKLDSRKTPSQVAEDYYDQYRKAKRGLEEIRLELERGETELAELEKTLTELLEENQENLLKKVRLLKTGGKPSPSIHKDAARRPGLSFRRKDWLIIVGRDATENDALLRKHVKGNDLWLHARDFPGSYVFIKQRAGKSVPLDILLDAGNLALFYSKGRRSAEGDLFYTPVKYLRRAKNGPKGLVIPTQEKNLHVKLESTRLKELESCRVEK